MTQRSIFVVLNEELADDPTVGEALSDLRMRGFDLRVRTASSVEKFRKYIERGVDDGVDVIVPSGGDGTINEVIHVLSETGQLGHCGIGILPAGTANDFATACGIPTNNPGAALRLAAELPLVEIDVGRVNDRFFVNAASGGYGAEVTATAPPELKKALGGFAYLVNGLVHVPEITPRQTRVRAPGLDWNGGMIGFSVGNGRLAGGGFEVAPNAKVDDGLLDLILFPEVKEGGWSGLVTDLIGKSDDTDFAYLVSHQAPWFEITVEETIHFNVDGEPLEAETLRFDVVRKAARFCLPKSDMWTP